MDSQLANTRSLTPQKLVNLMRSNTIPTKNIYDAARLGCPISTLIFPEHPTLTNIETEKIFKSLNLISKASILMEFIGQTVNLEENLGYLDIEDQYSHLTFYQKWALDCLYWLNKNRTKYLTRVAKYVNINNLIIPHLLGQKRPDNCVYMDSATTQLKELGLVQ